MGFLLEDSLGKVKFTVPQEVLAVEKGTIRSS